MAIYFVQPCSNCSRNRQMSIKELGREVQCPYCGHKSTAKDPDGESLALQDSMKEVAMLSDIAHEVARDMRRPR